MGLIRTEMIGEDLEDHPAKAGSYELRVTSATVKDTKGEGGKAVRKMIAVGMKVEGHDADNLSTVFHNLNTPVESDAPATQRMMNRDIKRFCKVFNIPLDSLAAIDETDPNASAAVAELFNGKTGKCPLKLVPNTRDDGSGKRQPTGDFHNELALPRFE